MKQFVSFQKEIQFVFGLRQEHANAKEATVMDSDMLNNAVAKLAAEVAKLSDVFKMNHALVLNESTKKSSELMTATVLVICKWDSGICSKSLALTVFALLQQLQVQLLLFACAYLEVNIDLMVMSVASYETAFMELHCGTLPRGYDEHHNVAKSVMDSKNDSKHVKQFFKYVQLPLLNNDVAAIRLNYSNLEDKVLIGVGSIVMNGSGPILVKQPNIKLSDLVWDPDLAFSPQPLYLVNMVLVIYCREAGF
ncbi:hypothetical protein K7X08_029177 [Anisodus acutangulus]|uniref:Uncharacterized protein n=1 Tax=Anisodus acutangulus TaxID=402998 RepID=A0A9Q1QVP6_9SOLA|nr:hypothetical protein K7X08_029177 [Anisodus acutangulus]